ncbi:MAG: hypothetical protein CR988_00990 [Treponema sp.]|nr:MAG: hypothetical protein CR988_00990 [Treponema sp.]
MKKKLQTLVLGLAVFSALVLSSCVSNAKPWKQGIDEKKGKSDKKDSMIIFTGSDWDERSKLAFEKLFTSEFFEKFSKDFDLYNVDIVRDKSLMSAKLLKTNYIYFSEYGVENLPYIVLQTPMSDAYASTDFGVECSDIKQFSQLVEKLLKKRDAVVKAREKIVTSKGHEKTKAIDDFLSIVENADSNRYDKLRAEALTSDPDNKTGLKSKYLMISADMKAAKLVDSKKFRDASNEFIKIAEMSELNGNDKQLAYYYAAYILAMQEGITSVEIKNLLQKALDSAPDSEFSIEVNNVMNNLKK